MAELIKWTHYERPSLPQSAPLRTIPLDLPRDLFSAEFFPAIVQQVGSYRANDKRKLQNQYTDFPQLAPLFAVASGALDKFVPAFTPSLVQLLSSFRLGATLPLDKFERTDFPQFAPLYAKLVGLTDEFSTEFISAIVQQLGSFRLRESLPRDKFERTDFPQSTPLRTIPLDLARDLFETQFLPSLLQSLGSFRKRDYSGDRFYILSDQPINTAIWAKANGLTDVFEIAKFVAMAAQALSFRATDGPRLEVRNHQWTQETTYIKPVIDPAPTATLFEGMKQFRDSRRR